MAIRLGDEAPDFTADTTEGTVDFHEWKGDSWAVLFSHPKDFTPVCTTELGRGRRAQAGVRQAQHQGDRPVGRPARQPREVGGRHRGVTGHELNFPLIADPDSKVADLYDMIHPNASDTATVRSVFVIGPDNKVKLTLTYPASTGRNFDEMLRVIDSLQLTANHRVATPADWKHGEDVIIVPAVSDEDAKAQVPEGLRRQEALPPVDPAARTSSRSARESISIPPRVWRWTASNADANDVLRADVRRRLRHAEGQVGAVVRLLDEGADCRAILTQLSAATRALQQAGFRCSPPTSRTA